MHNNYFLILKKWFHDYVASFYSDDEQLQFHVRLKEEHTLRVVKQASAIANWLKLSPHAIEMAQIGALLHDIGRFKQYQSYRTFNDALSVNHGELGVAVLEQCEILALAGLEAREQEFIKSMVLYHNRRHLPLDIEEECLTYAKIIRDADKLDIFAMLVTTNQENKIPRPPEVQNATQYSREIIDDIFQGNLVQHAAIKTAADLMLFRLSWLYDIYFAYSFSYIVQEQYLGKMVDTLPETEEIQRVYACLQKYVMEHISVDSGIIEHRSFGASNQ